MTSLYHENVMDHYKQPRNHGTLPHATVTVTDRNPLCGDVITVQLVIDKDRIVAARHDSRGCAISQAGASMLFEQLEGMTVAAVLALPKEDVLAEFGTELSVSRVKCALLALAAVKKALVEHGRTGAHA